MGLIHGNRDRRPQHRIGEEIRLDVLRLYRDKYHDFNFSHFTDCLKEAEGIDISRSSKELGIGQIFALTPQAKGRVERLWNTMQDRLPGELRLLGITDVDGANNVLPRLIAKHNEKFAVLHCRSGERLR